MNTTFTNPENGTTMNLDTISKTFHIFNQEWILGASNGINWLVPVGWSNNMNPICEESEYEAFYSVLQYAN